MVNPNREKYKNGKIYMLCRETTNDIYIGSTIQPLHIRLYQHKASYKRYLNNKCSYISSFEILKYEDVKIELIENYPCNFKGELESRERKWIEQKHQEREQKICNKNLPGQKNYRMYDNGKIYMLYCETTNEIYVGSTIQPLRNRFTQHKADYKRYLNNKSNYMTSFKILKHEDVKIELIEEYPCASREELEARERKWIEQKHQEQKICVNKVFPGRTQKEYYQDNKDYIKKYNNKYNKKYRKDKQEKIKERFRIYRNDNREKIKERFRKYSEANKDKIKEQHAKRYQANKDKIKKENAKPFVCECGSKIKMCSKAKHNKTKKHKNYISSQVSV